MRIFKHNVCTIYNQLILQNLLAVLFIIWIVNFMILHNHNSEKKKGSNFLFLLNLFRNSDFFSLDRLNKKNLISRLNKVQQSK